jgi:hypothetical protein
MNRAVLLQVAGLVAVCAAAFMWTPVIGVLAVGVALLLLGIAEEIR